MSKPDGNTTVAAADGRSCRVASAAARLEGRGVLLLIGAFLFCPCHLPLTLALAGMLLAGTAAGALLRSDLRPGDRVAPRTRGALSRAWLPLPTVNAGTVRPRGS